MKKHTKTKLQFLISRLHLPNLNKKSTTNSLCFFYQKNFYFSHKKFCSVFWVFLFWFSPPYHLARRLVKFFPGWKGKVARVLGFWGFFFSFSFFFLFFFFPFFFSFSFLFFLFFSFFSFLSPILFFFLFSPIPPSQKKILCCRIRHRRRPKTHPPRPRKSQKRPQNQWRNNWRTKNNW